MTKQGIIRSVLVMLLSVLFVTVLSFLLMRLSPVDPATAYVMRNSPIVTAEQIEEARVMLGMDKPIYVQYFTWLKDALQGNMGISLSTGEPVFKLLQNAIPVSLTVVSLSTLFMIVGVIVIGILQYLIQQSVTGKLIRALCIAGVSIPPFFLAIIFIRYFAHNLSILSITGNQGLMKYLPSALCLSVAGIAFYSQMLAARLTEEIQSDYVFFSKCRGLSDLRLVFFHALPAAVVDLISNFAQMIGLTLAAATIVERVFSLPGFGNLIIDSVVQRDAPVTHASVLFLAIVLVLLNFVAVSIQSFFQRNIEAKENGI